MYIARFAKDKKGSVSIMSALFIVLMVMVAAFALNASDIYLAKLKAQRTADIANLAAASTPSPVSGTTPSAMAIATAVNLAEINGYSASEVTTRTAPSPKDNTKLALVTKIDQDRPLLFQNILSTAKTVALQGASWASVSQTVAGDCIRSNAGPVHIYDYSVVTGSGCTIASASYLYVCGAASAAVNKAEVNRTAEQQKPYICSSARMTPALDSFTYNKPATDSLASDSRIQAIKTRLNGMRNGWSYGTISPTAYINPATPSGMDKTYSNTTATLSSSTRYGTVSVTNSSLTFNGSGSADPTCTAPVTLSGSLTLNGNNRLIFNSGCYTFAGTVTNAAGSRTVFEIAEGANVTFVFKSNLDNSTGTMESGNARYIFKAGINNASGNLTLGNGPFYLDGGSVANGSGKLAFGNGPFYLWGGSMSNASTGTMTFADGPFYFYGGSIYNVKGSLEFGNGPFEFQGGSLSLNAESQTSFGMGNMNFYGGSASFNGTQITFGKGGSATSGGSSMFFSGGSFAMLADHFEAIGTTIAFNGGTSYFYEEGTLTATAPTGVNPDYGYQNILFVVYGGAFNLNRTTAGTDTMAGIIYVPNTSVSIYRRQKVARPDGGCFQIVAGYLSIYEYANLDFSSCTGSEANGSSATRILQ